MPKKQKHLSSSLMKRFSAFSCINYYGTPVDYDDWKEVELQFRLYSEKLKKEINRHL